QAQPMKQEQQVNNVTPTALTIEAATSNVDAVENGIHEEEAHRFMRRVFMMITARVDGSELTTETAKRLRQDMVQRNDELRTKKVIKFRLGGSDHTLTLLEFTQRLGLYHVDEINDEGYEESYFEGVVEDDNLCGMPKNYRFIMRIAKRMGLPTNEVLNSLSALTYCRVLDATTLKKLFDSNRRLIAEDPAPGVP
ncbi:hypothetical protein Tco_0889233, partial [Tanacetum coccineum]